jgi:Putative metallopeptidase
MRTALIYILLAVASIVCTGPTAAQAPSAPISDPPRVQRFLNNMRTLSTLLKTNPLLRNFSDQQREDAVQFVTGNMLFVLNHELAHAAMSELKLPYFGRDEDAADAFAILRLLKFQNSLSRKALIESTKGWFLSARRDRKDGEKLVYYDDHSFDQQRAYQIVCMMEGSGTNIVVDIPTAARLSQNSEQTCRREYERALWSWNTLLEPHWRHPNDPRTLINVAYGEGRGALSAYEEGFKSLRVLELVANRISNDVRWPDPITLELKTCGFINAEWIEATRTITLCYELAEDFFELYRDFAIQQGRSTRVRKR